MNFYPVEQWQYEHVVSFLVICVFLCTSCLLVRRGIKNTELAKQAKEDGMIKHNHEHITIGLVAFTSSLPLFFLYPMEAALVMTEETEILLGHLESLFTAALVVCFMWALLHILAEEKCCSDFYVYKIEYDRSDRSNRKERRQKDRRRKLSLKLPS